MIFKMEMLLRLALFLKSLVYQITRPYYWYINRKPQPKISPNKNEILNLSAVTIAKKIRQREISCETIVTAYIDRIKQVNPLLNAVVEDRFEAAIQDAKAYDKKLEAGDVSAEQLELEQPLYGVPITVKESCAVKGLSHTGGAVARAGVKANSDGQAVMLLRNAGAIPLCVTNTPELCVGFETVNKLHGRTNNPFDISRTAGGSSGGEGALLGSSSSLIGIGSDIAGSIRLPAHINGVFGHKPTSGIIPIDGHFPNGEDPNFRKYLVLGPMARYAEDLELAFRVLTSRQSALLRMNIPVDVKSMKIRYMEGIEKSFGLIPVDEAVKKAVRDAAGYLETRGADVEKVNIEAMNDAAEIGMMLFAGMKTPPFLLIPEDPKHESNPIAEIGKSIFGLSRHTESAILFKFLKDFKVLLPRSKISFYRGEAEKLHRTFTDLLGTDGVCLMPTYISSAPYHGQVTLQLIGTVYCFIFNILGFPSTNVPMGFDSEGLPVGIQVVACPMQDRLCLAVAKELEKGFGGSRLSPPTVI